MAGVTSLDAVKRRIKSLQEQVDAAEDRAERIQKELLAERKARDQVSMLTYASCSVTRYTSSPSLLAFFCCIVFSV